MTRISACPSSLFSGVRRLVGEAAFVGVAADADVTLFAPTGAPGVLDFPVVSGISAITNCEDTVVKVGAASAAEDTRFVELESRLIGFNGNTDGLTINGGTQSVFGVGHILVVSDLGISGHGAGSGFASTILSRVRISGFSAETVGHDVFEGVVHKTTRAAKVAITDTAVHELLFRERGQMAVFELNNAFNRASGTERPARATLALILDTSDGAFRNPVEGARRISTDTEIL